MKYNFDLKHNRINTNCVKWENNSDILPMWVADMDFETAPFIKEAVVNKAKLGIYGYSYAPKEYFYAYARWWEKRHGVKFDLEKMIFTQGVVAGIASIIKALTNEKDDILVQSPVYNCFYRKIKDTKRNVITNDLIYENGSYKIDFLDLENKLARNSTKMLILCNPHNPIGMAWSKEELLKIGLLCKKYGVYVIADEIHCDFIHPGCKYVPFMSVDESFKEFSITCVSTSKTFNLAGLHASCVIAGTKELYENIQRQVEIDENGSVNCFAVESSIAALTNGEEWINELNLYIYDNKEYVINFIKETKLKLFVVPSNSTYLLWIDVKSYTNDADKLCEYLINKANLKLCSGKMYGENGKTFVRMNIATPKSNVIEGMNRFKNALTSYKE